LSAGDLAHDTAEDEDQSDLQAEDLLKSMSFDSPYCRQFFILNSLANAVNIPIKHLHVYGLYLLPTTAKPFASETRFMAFLSGLQTLSVDVSSLGPTGFVWPDEFYVKFWKGISRLLPAVTDVTSLVLGSSQLWNAM
jgi:hypothetical protein